MSTPTISEFRPQDIKWQIECLKSISGFDYKKGIFECLLSGSVGSAKSIVLAHLAVLMSLKYKNNTVIIGRRAMPQLKDTLLQMIIEHIGTDVNYEFNSSRGIIKFPNGSRIIAFSWADGNTKKARSYAASSIFIEELTENDDDEFYKELKMRAGRLNHIPESMIVCATNPDSPAHWAYKYFVMSKSENRKTFYSLTEHNPFLPQTYIQNIKETLSDKEIRRMLYGEWIEIKSDQVYYNYETTRNFINNKYVINKTLPIDIAFDFNIGENKPLSCCLSQYVNGKFHVFKETHIFSARTLDVVEDVINSGIFDNTHTVRIFGDASGKNRDTRSLGNDYDIIMKAFSNLTNKRIEYKILKANPPVRRRHNTLNGMFSNSLGEVRLYVYEGCEWVDEGLRLTKYKQGSGFIEDDSLPQQHVTTALGYMVDYIINLGENRKSSQIQL